MIMRNGSTSQGLVMNKGSSGTLDAGRVALPVLSTVLVWVFSVYDEGRACTKSNRPANNRLSMTTQRYSSPGN